MITCLITCRKLNLYCKPCVNQLLLRTWRFRGRFYITRPALGTLGKSRRTFRFVAFVAFGRLPLLWYQTTFRLRFRRVTAQSSEKLFIESQTDEPDAGHTEGAVVIFSPHVFIGLVFLLFSNRLSNVFDFTLKPNL